MKSTDIIKASANSLNIYSFTAEALERLIESVKAEKPCPTCEALARTVMLDQTSHDTQRTWVGLTDREIDDLYCKHHDEYGCQLSATGYERAIEAKLMEKNT